MECIFCGDYFSNGSLYEPPESCDCGRCAYKLTRIEKLNLQYEHGMIDEND